MVEHQDWNVEVLNKSKNIENQSKKKVVLSEDHSRLVKLTNNTGEEGFHIEKVSYSLKMQIQKARNANKLSQKDLAFKIGVHAKMINEYESGIAIPNHTILMKMQKCLGVKFER